MGERASVRNRMNVNEAGVTSQHRSVNLSPKEKILCASSLFFNRLCGPVGVHSHMELCMPSSLSAFCCCSVQRSNCYMVWGADAVGPSSSSRSNSDLEIGCLIDLATGLVSFTANGKELPTTYQVNKNNSAAVGRRGLTHKDSLPRKLQYVYVIISFSRGKYTVFVQSIR